jgi:uncharacterized protein YggE
MPRLMAMGKGAVADTAPTEIEAGEVEIAARVRVWFAVG